MSIIYNDHWVFRNIDQNYTNFKIYLDEVDVHLAVNDIKNFQDDLGHCKDLTFNRNWDPLLYFEDS